MVSFSFATFPLSEESVALALQCCLGGDHSGFRVLKLSDRRFRFSVASNRVGHFVYGLRDRIWPDFICHFKLFHGDYSAAVDDAANYWLSSKFSDSVSPGRSVAVRYNLNFLQS